MLNGRRKETNIYDDYLVPYINTKPSREANAEIGRDKEFYRNLRPLLDPESEGGYIEECEEGERKAIERLATLNSPLVPVIVSKWVRITGVEVGDAFDEGNQALYDCSDKFDPERGSFGTLLELAIMQRIKNLIRGESRRKAVSLDEGIGEVADHTYNENRGDVRKLLSSALGELTNKQFEGVIYSLTKGRGRRHSFNEEDERNLRNAISSLNMSARRGLDSLRNDPSVIKAAELLSIDTKDKIEEDKKRAEEKERRAREINRSGFIGKR